MTSFGSSKIETCVLGDKRSVIELMNKGFHTITLLNSDTNESVVLEITDMFISELVIHEEDEDIKLV